MFRCTPGWHSPTAVMKTLFLLSVLLAVTAAWPSLYQSDAGGVSVAKKQQDVNRLLFKVTEKLAFAELKDLADNFNPTADVSMYTDEGKSASTLMKELNEHRLLEQHHWFSLFNTRHQQEALMLFDLLMHCKKWICFIGNAAFFREHMNEGEFIYAMYTGLIHSDLGIGLVLPPLYEITPHMFTNSEIIQKAYTAQMTQTSGDFEMHWTGSRKNSEQHVAYFGEDIGMNVHHVAWHMDFPFWWEDKYGYHLDRKGELFFWAHHQLTVRFDAERLSNHLDMVEELYWDRPIVEGFAPHTSYRYGGEFPTRPDNIEFADIDGVIRVRDMIIKEERIRDAIAHGFIEDRKGNKIDMMNDKGIDVLGNIIESSLYSPNIQYYGALHNHAHVLLGRQSDPHGKFALPPSVMEHFETATRDPAFFRLHKYMDGIFKEHKDTLKPYTKEEIEFPRVHVGSATIEGELETYFENFHFDLNMAIDSSSSREEHDVKAHVPRLNHKDFSYNIHILNDNAEAHAVVRIYLCPKSDNNGVEFTLDQQRWHCIEMDKFWQHLDNGENKIVRKSSESSITIPDLPSFGTLMEEADEAVKSGSTPAHSGFRSCGLPNRMLLPKGKEEGMVFSLVVAVTDATQDPLHEELEKKDHKSHAHCGINGEKYPDHRPMGFPFDRKIDDTRVILNADNIAFSDVKVFHKE